MEDKATNTLEDPGSFETIPLEVEEKEEQEDGKGGPSLDGLRSSFLP